MVHLDAKIVVKILERIEVSLCICLFIFRWCL